MMTDLKRIAGSAFESVLLHVPMPDADGSHKPGKRSLKARAEGGANWSWILHSRNPSYI